MTRDELEALRDDALKGKEAHLAQANVFAGMAMAYEKMLERLNAPTADTKAAN